ncbi:MAG: CHC2 zinc finger domain-containing protein [Chlamydiota bacterium]
MSSYHCKKNSGEVKAAIDPRGFYLVEQGLDRIKSGAKQWAIAGCCPFHEDSSPGSFYVHLESGAFNCFSCGAKGGDIISFTQKKYELSFREALEKLANDWRIK